MSDRVQASEDGPEEALGGDAAPAQEGAEDQVAGAAALFGDAIGGDSRALPGM